ncbi:GH25 family lysozyme [uncultured Enterovirga sp.]|uniref:glycoside hydrolase family 25 protein n=1 Tax=uncultured Enterovirga sp. TaxID=2026352 RepID=UPI0035CA7199
MTLASRLRTRLGVMLRVGTAGAIALGIAACAAQVGRDSYGDVKPHPGVEKAHALPIHGIDVSRWQRRIDWASVAASGKRFAFIKATEGGDHVDPLFLQNWEGARQAGVARGAYHFMFWCRPAEDQAVWFRKVVPQDASALPPVLDVEWNGESKTCPGKLSRPKALEMIRLMLREMQAHTGKRPIIYTDITFHEDILEGELREYAHWIRSTAAEPHVRYKDRTWTIWQYTTTGRVPGISGAVDRNAFHGSEAEWQAFVRGGCDSRFGCG